MKSIEYIEVSEDSRVGQQIEANKERGRELEKRGES